MVDKKILEMDIVERKDGWHIALTVDGEPFAAAKEGFEVSVGLSKRDTPIVSMPVKIGPFATKKEAKRAAKDLGTMLLSLSTQE